MKILLRVLFLIAVLEAGQTTVPAAGTPSMASRVRCLFLIDTSRALGEHKSDILEAVTARLANGLNGQLRAGDVFLIRTFGETLPSGVTLQGVWNPHLKQTIPAALAEALRDSSFKGRSRLDLALRSTADLAAREDELLVVIVTDAATPVSGTPFDAHINGACQLIASREGPGSNPVAVTLLTGSGRMLAWSVEPVSLSAVPAAPASPTPVRPQNAAAPHPAPRPVTSPKPAFERPPETPKVAEALHAPVGTNGTAEPPPAQSTPAKLEEVKPAASVEIASPPDPGPSNLSSAQTESAQAVAPVLEAPLAAPPASEEVTNMAALKIPDSLSKAPPASDNVPVKAEPADAPPPAGFASVTPANQAESAPALPAQEVPPLPKAQATDKSPLARAPELPRTPSRAFLILGSSFIAAALAGLGCFARRRKPAPAQSLISRSIDGAK